MEEQRIAGGAGLVPAGAELPVGMPV